MNNFLTAVVAAVIAAGAAGAVIGAPPDSGPGSVAQAEDAACLPEELAHVPPIDGMPLAAGSGQKDCGNEDKARTDSEPPDGANQPVAGLVSGDFGECGGALENNQVDLTFEGLLEGEVNERCAKPRPICDVTFSGGYYNPSTQEGGSIDYHEYRWASTFEGETILIDVSIQSPPIPHTDVGAPYTVSAARAKDIGPLNPGPGEGVVRVRFPDDLVYETEAGSMEVDGDGVTVDADLSPIQGVSEEDVLTMTGSWSHIPSVPKPNQRCINQYKAEPL